MNTQQLVIEAMRTHSPKHGIKFEAAIREANTEDIAHLAHLCLYMCLEHKINTSISNPFDPVQDAKRHADWAAWFEPIDKGDEPMPTKAPTPVERVPAPAADDGEISHVGGGYYEVPGVGRVRGKQEALDALKSAA